MRRLVPLAVAAAAVATPCGVRAETMNEALASSYKVNPRLDSARATQRATDEEVPHALSGYRPTVTGTADTSFERTTTRPPSVVSGESNPRGYAVQLAQPLFQGFRVVNTVAESEAT